MKEARARGRGSISTLRRESRIIRGTRGGESVGGSERERERGGGEGLAIDRRAAQFEFIRLIPPADSAGLRAPLPPSPSPFPNETKLLSYRR